MVISMENKFYKYHKQDNRSVSLKHKSKCIKKSWLRFIAYDSEYICFHPRDTALCTSGSLLVTLATAWER